MRAEISVYNRFMSKCRDASARLMLRHEARGREAREIERARIFMAASILRRKRLAAFGVTAEVTGVRSKRRK
jgi:hypothetical protein